MLAPTAPRLIELAGSPRERGRRHGELLSREIRGLRRALLQYLFRLTLGLGGLPLLGALELLARLAFWSRIPPRLQDELKGVAAGAQVNLSLVVLINVLDDLANNWPACSALAVGEEPHAWGLLIWSAATLITRCSWTCWWTSRPCFS